MRRTLDDIVPTDYHMQATCLWINLANQDNKQKISKVELFKELLY